jgi:nucleotide-binding universal stress UspA family protein
VASKQDDQPEARSSSGPSLPELARVLVPLDLSERSLAAVPFAYALAGRGGCVTLLHVIEPMTEPNPLYAHYTAGRKPTRAEQEAQAADLRTHLESLVPHGPDGPTTEIELAEGEDVPACILDVADRLETDAICMASHGRRGLARVLLGSVAEGVVQSARWPVLIVPSAGA